VAEFWDNEKKVQFIKYNIHHQLFSCLQIPQLYFSMINKLERAVLCWLLAFKASRKNKQKRTFILFTTEHTKHSALWA
jgi:hypothetical protein